jgi:cell division protease FtsH
MSTGASNDFERATKLARAMVTKYGMSDLLGTMVYADDDAGFGVQNKTISEATQQKVDAEIRRILDEQYSRGAAHPGREAQRGRGDGRGLLEWETIDAEQVKALMEGRTPTRPPGWVAKPAGGGKDDSSTPTAPVLVDPAPQT